MSLGRLRIWLVRPMPFCDPAQKHRARTASKMVWRDPHEGINEFDMENYSFVAGTENSTSRVKYGDYELTVMEVVSRLNRMEDACTAAVEWATNVYVDTGDFPAFAHDAMRAIESRHLT